MQRVHQVDNPCGNKRRQHKNKKVRVVMDTWILEKYWEIKKRSAKSASRREK